MLPRRGTLFTEKPQANALEGFYKSGPAVSACKLVPFVLNAGVIFPLYAYVLNNYSGLTESWDITNNFISFFNQTITGVI